MKGLGPSTTGCSSCPGSSREERFRSIYEASYTPLLGYALRRSRTLEEAADVVAETFLVAWRRLETFRPATNAAPGFTG